MPPMRNRPKDAVGFCIESASARSHKYGYDALCVHQLAYGQTVLTTPYPLSQPQAVEHRRNTFASLYRLVSYLRFYEDMPYSFLSFAPCSYSSTVALLPICASSDSFAYCSTPPTIQSASEAGLPDIRLTVNFWAFRARDDLLHHGAIVQRRVKYGIPPFRPVVRLGSISESAVSV